MCEQDSEYLEIQSNFALNLLRETQLEGLKSSVLSPISISLGLAILYNGASGNTAKQITDVIAGGKSLESINEYFSEMFKLLQSSEDEKFTLKTVNRIFAAKNYVIFDKFVDTIKQYYMGEFSQLDFENDVEGSREEINNFVESATKNLIKNMVPEDGLNPLTRLVLVNAIYFLGEWQEPFMPAGPYDKREKFYVSKDITREVFYMNSFNDKYYRYEATSDYEVLGIHYKGGDYAMFILLPKSVYGLPKIIEKLNGSILTKHAKNKKTCICQVKMPKFGFNLKMDLIKVLKNLGIKDAFDPDAADFSNMTESKKLYLYASYHQAYIKVNEKGTEMAACTTSQAMKVSGGPTPRPKVKFTANHSFLYFVSDKNGNILFLGTVVDAFQEDSQNFVSNTKKTDNTNQRVTRKRHYD